MQSTKLISIYAVVLFAVLAMPLRLAAQDEQQGKHELPRYTVQDLGALGGTFSYGQGINNKGGVTGTASIRQDKAQRAFFWKKGHKIDLGTLGGPNSKIVLGKPNEKGAAAGYAETSNPDPLGEDFCGFGTQLSCLPFLWRKGTMIALPTLGGNNGGANDVSNDGQVVGLAENTTLDSTCSNSAYQLEPVIWEKGVPNQLRTVSGDPDGFVNAINDRGQAVGGSGDCLSGPAGALHAVLWQNGSPVDLGNLGGMLFSQGSNINDQGQVIGASDLPGDTNFWAGPFINYHGFLWEKGALTDLGTLPGDTTSFPNSINNKDQITGGGSRAILWDRGRLTDLNTLVPGPPFSPLYLLFAADINDRGEIVGQGLTINGELHAYLAIPCDENHSNVEGCLNDAGPYSTQQSIQQAPTDASEISAGHRDGVPGRPSGAVSWHRPESFASRYFSNLKAGTASRP
jgi:probable HAF family extracellular repeat protein